MHINMHKYMLHEHTHNQKKRAPVASAGTAATAITATRVKRTCAVILRRINDSCTHVINTIEGKHYALLYNDHSQLYGIIIIERVQMSVCECVHLIVDRCCTCKCYAMVKFARKPMPKTIILIFSVPCTC